MANINVTIRMDEKLKKEADSLFKDLGMNLTTAINTFIKQSIREQKIPFEISKKSSIEYLTNDEINKAFDKEFVKHAEAYKKLSKWNGFLKKT